MFKFLITGFEIMISVSKNPIPLIKSDANPNGAMTKEDYDLFGDPPVEAWRVKVNHIDIHSTGEPEGDSADDIDVMANGNDNIDDWDTVLGAEFLMYEWEDKVLIFLSDKDIAGYCGTELSTNEIREIVINNRIAHRFGDGFEREHAEAGYVDIGNPIDEMSRADLIAEITGTFREPTMSEHAVMVKRRIAEMSREMHQWFARINGASDYWTRIEFMIERLEQRFDEATTRLNAE